MRIFAVLVSLCLISGCPERRKTAKPAAPAAPPSTSKKRAAPTLPRATTAEPALPAGAHPDYPTAQAAGTDKLFVVEEPDRGPWTTSVTLPSRDGLAWETYAVCEASETAMACGRSGEQGLRSRWRVGSRAGHQVLAERLAGDVTRERIFFDWTAKGRLSRVVRLDSRGQVVSASHFDPAGRQLSARKLNGSNALAGCGHMGLKLDGKGRVAELECLQWNGESMRDLEGVRVRKFRLDAGGFLVEETRRTPEGSPMADNDGIHRKVIRRDPMGRRVEVTYHDIEGQPALSTQNGCYGERYRYDHRGYRVEKICLGAQGRPMRGRDGASRETYDVDDHGCTVYHRYLDPTGKPTTTVRGISEERFSASRTCETQIRTCYALGARRACGPNEPSRYVHRYDEHGRLVATDHFNEPQRGGARDEPGLDPVYRVFEVRYWRDRLGNITETSCFGAQGGGAVPINCAHAGYHRDQNRTDHAGRVVERRFFDVAGRPAANLGCELRRFRYDNYDHTVEQSEHMADGTSRETEGMAIRRTLFDQSHRRFAELLYDGQGKPARYRACFMGAVCPLPRAGKNWHAVRIVRAKNGEIEKNLFFDHQGALILSVDCHGAQCWD